MAEPRPWTCSCHDVRVLWSFTQYTVRCAVTGDVIAHMPRHPRPIDPETGNPAA